MGSIKDRQINALLNGYEYGGRIRWWYEKGDVFEYMRDINSPVEAGRMSKRIPEMRWRELEHHLTPRGRYYFSTEEGQKEVKLLLAFLRSYGDGEWFAELEQQRKLQEQNFTAELSEIRKRIASGDFFLLDDFLDRNPSVYDDPLLVWPNIDDKDSNRQFAMRCTEFFGNKWRSRFCLFPTMLRSMQYANSEAVSRIFARGKAPRNDEIIAAIRIAIFQLARTEIDPDAFVAIAYASKRCISRWCTKRQPINPFRDMGTIGEDGEGTLADAWYVLAQVFDDMMSGAEVEIELNTYFQDVSTVARDVLEMFIAIRPL
ncbi:hypothetical protein BYI23_F000080 (plasmid) [Burkholderia sp. YI23]|nr:hypothetical protein BYI23_F000080 [Burkholderia sp. YI23]